MEPRTRILTEADSLFKRRGVRAVTMDDIARELGMSKKTLYQYFSNKAEIVQGVSSAYFEQERCMTDEIMEKAKDPVEEILLILQAFTNTMHEIPTNMVYEIQKYYPKAWCQFHEFKETYIMDAVRQNLITGVEKGLYRKDMDIEIVTKLRVEQLEMIFDQDKFPPKKYDAMMVQAEQFTLFLHGIVTMKGKKLIYKYLNQPLDE